MYDDQFGLTGRPFQLTSDPRFWFETATHRKAMAYLGYGLAQGEGIMVLTGGSGTGKTTLAAHLLATTDPTRLHPITIDSAIEAENLLRTVAAGLGIAERGSKAELLREIKRGLLAAVHAGRRTLLVIDEAQALLVFALDDLLVLSDLQAGGQVLLQILLLGQPEFRDRLHDSEPLRRRVVALHHLDAMDPEEVETYIAHRLSVAGWQGRPDFADEAFPVMFWVSQGSPRELNRLADHVLLHCARESVELIDAGVVMAVAGELLSGDVPWSAQDEFSEPDQGRSTRPLLVAVPRAVRPAAVETVEPVSLEARLAALETQIANQDAALRRVLALMIDWVESEEVSVRDAA